MRTETSVYLDAAIVFALLALTFVCLHSQAVQDKLTGRVLFLVRRKLQIAIWTAVILLVAFAYMPPTPLPPEAAEWVSPRVVALYGELVALRDNHHPLVVMGLVVAGLLAAAIVLGLLRHWTPRRTKPDDPTESAADAIDDFVEP